MRITSTLLAAGILTLTSVAVQANDNKAFVWQAGKHNTAYIQQLGKFNQVGTYGSALRQGDGSAVGNKLNIEQVGKLNEVAKNQSAGHSIQRGRANEATLDQLGRRNAINTLRQSGNNSLILVKQYGKRNLVKSINQVGSSSNAPGGKLYIYQTGDDHVIKDVIQVGARNHMLLDQQGDANTVTLAKQQGNDNIMKLWQYAGTTGNNAELSQHGDDNEIYVHQESDDNFVVVRQVGNNLKATIHQDGLPLL